MLYPIASLCVFLVEAVIAGIFFANLFEFRVTPWKCILVGLVLAFCASAINLLSHNVPGINAVSTIVMMLAMVAIFYFLLIRPQRKKDKQVKDMLSALKVGDRICTIGGLYGTIAALKDDTVTLTLGSLQNTVVIARWAVRSVENVALENDTEPQI